VKDYYRTLQVDPSADADVVEAAYKRLARKYHPDLNRAPSAAELMKELNAAYEVVGDAVRRREYDRERAASAQAAAVATAPAPTRPTTRADPAPTPPPPAAAPGPQTDPQKPWDVRLEETLNDFAPKRAAVEGGCVPWAVLTSAVLVLDFALRAIGDEGFLAPQTQLRKYLMANVGLAPALAVPVAMCAVYFPIAVGLVLLGRVTVWLHRS
jgi:hypothetical protein